MIKGLAKAIGGKVDGKLIELEKKNNRSERRYLKGVNKKLENFRREISNVFYDEHDKNKLYITIKKLENQNA